MRMQRFILVLLFIFFLQLSLFAEQGGYIVIIEGVKAKTLFNELKDSSVTVAGHKKPFSSLQALQQRIQPDIEKFVQIAKYHGYYSAKVTYSLKYTEPMQILFHVDLGRQYTLGSFEVLSEDGRPIFLGPALEIGKPVTTQMILDAEKTVIWTFKKQGFGLCQILEREVIANVADHTLSLRLRIQKGPLLRFGPCHISGNTNVLSRLISKRLLWKEGDPYDPQKLEQSQVALEKTGLFSSVILSEQANALTGDKLPVDIQLQESKHKSLGAGLAYTTTFGAGVRAEWENRNFQGEGNKVRFRTEWWKKYQSTLLSLTQPYYDNKEQALIWLLEYNKLNTTGFDSHSYTGSSLLQKKCSEKTELGYGGSLQWLHSNNFEGSHIYYLIKIPLQLKWSNANNLLDPTRGQTVNVKLTPTAQIFSPHFCYTLHTTSLTTYHSIPTERLTVAARVVMGNVIGASQYTIPPPDRMYGGSENILRGYRAFTVSPLHNGKTPIGGRSLLAASLEARFRTSGELGWAFFYDIGNVYSTPIPEPYRQQRCSVGTGIRYATPIGPLRFDIAVPLNRRSAIDPSFQIYFSIGQSF